MSAFSSSCPVCEAEIRSASSVELSEILQCPDCRTRLVATQVQGFSFDLQPAPQIEEDWGQ